MTHEDLKKIAQKYKTELALLDVADNLPKDQADAIRMQESWGRPQPKIRLAGPYEFDYGMRTDDTDAAGLMRCEFYYRVHVNNEEMHNLRSSYEHARQTIADASGVEVDKVRLGNSSEIPFYEESWKPEHRALLRSISNSLDAVITSLEK